jgi:tetratricopeptide (TPR) repeat protein
LASTLHAENLLIIPFFNESKVKEIEWIGDGISEKLFEVAVAAGRSVVDAEERDEMLRQMAIRRYARLTKASVTEIGVNLDANEVLYGDFQFTAAPAGEGAAGAGQAGGQATGAGAAGSAGPAGSVGGGEAGGAKVWRGTIRIQAQLMNIREVKRGPTFVVSGPIEQLSRLETELAWQVVKALAPGSSQSEQEFVKRHPSIRLDAMESYVRGLLSTMPDQKLRLFAQAARLEPGYSQPCFHLGKMLYSRRDYRQASEWFQKVVEIDAHYREAQFLLGVCLYQLADYAGAGARFGRLAETVPLAEVLNNLGVARLKTGDPSAAESLKRAVAVNGSDPDLHFNAGYALWRQGSWEEAAGYFRGALQRRPEDQDATFLLGRCLARNGPKAGEVRTEGLERLKREYNEKAWLSLQSVLKK